jgi:2-C-methyl-D-erythritol 2,4-cyclodiphosphate synthase
MPSVTTRFGLGYDSHRFGAARPLILGGVTIEHTSGLVGHSDGDAVAHAVTDAILGAAAMGDIGRLFPDTDPQWKGADSLRLLADARRRVVAGGFRVVNLDVTVVTEAPRLSGYVDRIRANLAAALDVPPGAVSVKAKTNEGLDDIGQGRGLQVFAVASLAEA